MLEVPDVLVDVRLLLEEVEEGLWGAGVPDAEGEVVAGGVVVVVEGTLGVVCPVVVVDGTPDVVCPVVVVDGVVCVASVVGAAVALLPAASVAALLPVAAAVPPDAAGVWADVVLSPLNAAASEDAGRLATGTGGISGWAGD